jgi:hypothetical protein
VLTAVMLIGLAGCLRAQGPSEPRTASLLYVTVAGLEMGTGALRLRYAYAQQGGEPLAFEAERATEIRLAPTKGQVRHDPAASGGLFLTHVDHAAFRFTLRTGGKYTAWYRGCFPWKGAWNHTENMDCGQSQIVVDSQGEVLKKWLWSKGPTYDLKAGEHCWNLSPSGWCGGCGLDKLMLVPEGTPAPEGLGPPSASSTGKTSGVAITEQVAPRHVAAWGRVAVTNASGTGQVKVEYTADHGGTWQELPADGSLSAVPPNRPLAFRLTITADTDGATPFVTGVTLSYTARSVPPIVLENAQMCLRFSGENGALLGIRNQVTKTEYTDRRVQSPLFNFTAFRPDLKTTVEIGFNQAQLLKVAGPADGMLSLDYQLMGGAMTAAVKVRLEAQLARFSMTVANHSELYQLAQVRLLPLKGLRIGESCQDDYLCQPVCGGAIVRYPASLEYPRTVYTDRPLAWPGQASMCWMDLWDEQGGGLYYAGYDPNFYLTELTFNNGQEDRPQGAAAGAPLPPTDAGYRFSAVPGTYINLGFDKRLLISPQTGPVSVPEVVVGVHQGDWHWGADRYREWASTWLHKVKQTPDWLRDIEGWTDCHMIHLGSFVELTKGRPKGGRKIAMADPPYPLIAMWAQMASCEAYWGGQVLHRLLGTAEQFQGGIQKQHELGHRFMSYNLPAHLNATQHWGFPRAGNVPMSLYPRDEIPAEGFYPQVGVRLFDGSLRSPAGIYSEANCCLGAAAWRDYERHIVLDKYVRQYGNDGMYLDGAGLWDLGTQDCKNLAHGHTGYGQWTQGFLQWLGEVKSESRKIRPGAVYAGEGLSDVAFQYLDLSLFYPDNAPQVYLYSMPGNYGVIHGAEFPFFKDWPAGYMEFASVYGLKFGGADWTFEKDPERARKVLAFRQKISQFQFRSRFLDDQGLVYDDAEVTAKLFVRDEPGTRGAMVVAYNPKLKDRVTVSVDQARVGALKTAWYFDYDGQLQPLAAKRASGTYQFAFPATSLSACFLLERCEPLMAVDKIASVVPGESGTARVTATNLESGEINGSATLGSPAGWQVASQPFRLAAGQSQSCELRFTVPVGTKWDVYDVYGVAQETGRVTKRCVMMGVCRPVQAELYWTKRDMLRLALNNSSGREIQATARLVLPVGVTATPAEAPLALAPRGSGELLFQIANVGSVLTRQSVTATIRYGSEESFAYEHLQPPLINGNFEQCTAGDNWPDYWNYRRPECLYLKGAALDANDKVEGRYSLRIDPNPREAENSLQTSFVRLLPNTRYRLSGWIKCTAVRGTGIAIWSIGALDPKRAVSFSIGGGPTAKSGQWQKFEGEFLSADIDVPYGIQVANWNQGEGTAWYDDIRLEEVQ